MSEPPRITTGIGGLDKLLAGGLLDESVVMVSGASGVGKTLFCVQYLFEGLKNDEQCLFISLEEPIDDIRFDARMLGMPFDEYEASDQLETVYLDPSNDNIGFFNQVNQFVTQSGADRIAIDSVSVMLGEQGGDQAAKRKNLYNLNKNLKRTDATTIITTEMKEENNEYLSRYGVAEYVADGVIMLDYLSMGEESFRNIEVRKMRGTAYEPGAYPFEITDKGLQLHEETRI